MLNFWESGNSRFRTSERQRIEPRFCIALPLYSPLIFMESQTCWSWLEGMSWNHLVQLQPLWATLVQHIHFDKIQGLIHLPLSLQSCERWYYSRHPHGAGLMDKGSMGDLCSFGLAERQEMPCIILNGHRSIRLGDWVVPSNLADLFPVSLQN